MEILKTKNYLSQVKGLEPADRRLLERQEKLLMGNLFDPRLHTKKLKGFGDDLVYSFRITRSHRGIFRLQDNAIILFTIGHRKDIYRRLR